MYTKHSTHLVMAGALVASPFIGACDCTTFGLDPVESTISATTTVTATTTTSTATPTTGSGEESTIVTSMTTIGVIDSTSTSTGTTGTTDTTDTSTASTSTGSTTTDSTTAVTPPPAAPVLHLEFSAIKQFDFSWSAVPYAELYRLIERPNPDAEYAQLGDDIVGEAISWTMPLHLRHTASYILQACNDGGCTDSAQVAVANPLVAAIGYFKPNVIDMGDYFGVSVALSGDGNTLVVGAAGEGSATTDPDNDAASDAGAVSVFVRTGSGWTHQAYLKASNIGEQDLFGHRVALSDDGDTLAVAAIFEDGSSKGVGGLINEGATNSGAVYIFVRDGADWDHQAYVKATNTEADDFFGSSIALSSDGDTLAIGAANEDSGAAGVGGDQTNNGVSASGAVYVYIRTNTVWQYQAYVKATNTDAGDNFGNSVALSADGDWLAVGAPGEASNATAPKGDQNNNSKPRSGAVYIYERTNATWDDRVYIKAFNSDSFDSFGESVALSAAADTLAVGAPGEGSIDGDKDDNSAPKAGAAYVFTRAGNVWAQQAYIKSSDITDDDEFGRSLDLSANGDQLVLGAVGEDSSKLGVVDQQYDDLANGSGAAYVFVRTDGVWAQQTQIKASNTGSGDDFGSSVSLADDGQTLAVTGVDERSAAVGIGGNQNDNSLMLAGACYLY